ncbi:K02A2.6-like [Cordylochernes scorpioides]|uniref:K02A2.6-like n=1 Tax=Cordylochernes scorpioides TaxID=51811 RepID=A0ABY6KY98_9ARAC|nr:K02A2.6-like [Cordylochernes scorpioides]
MSCTRSNPPNGYTAENRTSTTLQNRTTSPALERAMVTIAHQDNVLQPTNKLSFISPLQPHHMVESSVGPAPQAANINIGYGETPCFNPEEEDIEDYTWLTASKVPKGDWTKALVRRLPLDGREFIKCRFDPSAALEDVLEALKPCYPRNDGRARSRGIELKKMRRPQSTEDTGKYLMNLITAHATAGEFSPFNSSKEALWALAPKDCLLLAASWSTTRNPEEADFLQAAKFLDETNKWNKARTEAGTTTSWETTTRTAEEWEQKQGRNPRTKTPMEKARRFMLPDGTPRCFTCYQTGHKHWDCPKRRPRGKYNFASNPVVEVSNSVESVPRVFSEVTGNTNRIIFRVKGQPGVNEKQTLNKVPIEKSTLEIGGTAMEKFRWTGMTNFCLITHINETHVGKLIFDSGANVSCIDEGIANALGCARMPSKLLIRGISGSVISNTCTYLEVNIDGFDICGRFTIIPGNGEKIIFGVDILTNYHCKTMFRDESVELYRPKIGRDDHVVELNEEWELERLSTITSDRKNPKQKYCILDDLEIAPRCKTRVKLKGPTVMAGILEPHPDCVRRTGLLIPSVHVSETVSEIFIDVINTRNEPVRLVANSCLLRSGGEIANVSFLSEQVGYSTTATCKYEPQKFDINPELSDSEKIDVLDVLYRNRELFSEEWNKAADIEPYHIKLKANTEPIRQKAYRRSPKERDIIEEQVKEMCEKGVIRKSTSPWASPVVLVKKSDGSYRFCVDYRKVNNVTEKFSYPLLDITDCLDRLAGMKYFSHTDFVSGYWQCPLDETSKPITAFTTGNGLYEFQVLPFGLTGAPGHFERIMDTLLAELKWSECMVYLDDIIVYGRDIREHNVRLTNVLECFRGAGLSLKPSKCRFAYQKLPILGHVVSENGVEPATDKIEAVKEFPIPKNVKQVRSFLGLCGYYRRFIKKLFKDKQTADVSGRNRSFRNLKKKLTEEPILAHFNPDARIEIHTDASIVGLGAVLMQPDNDGFLHPIHYLSRTTSKHESKYGISELECLAIVWALQKLRPYIFGREFKVVTDHSALTWLANVPPLEPLPPATDIWERVGIDHQGPFKKSVEGYEHILTIVDHFSKYAIAIPVKDTKAETTCNALSDNLLYVFGTPKCIISDQGKSFDSSTFRDFTRLYGIKHIMASAAHPQTNGLCEKLNGIIKNGIRVSLEDDHAEWPRFVKTATFAYNSSIQSSTQVTPHKLIFGVEPRTSLDVGLPTVDEPVKTYDEYVTNRILENERLKKIADENYRDRTMMTKCQYDLANRDRFRKFEVGDLVLLESSRRKPGKTEKFLPKYVGPYIITDRIKETTYRLRPQDGRNENRATVNVLNFADLCKIMQDGNPSLKPSYIKLRCYGGEILKPRGQIKINCSHQSKQHPIVFQVIDHWEKPILSAETCQKLNLIEIKADLCKIESTWTKQNNLLDKYKDIFEGIGCLQGEYKLETDPTIKPIKQAPRRVPITLRKELKEKLIDMEKKNIIAKVDYPTDWISNLVLVKSTKKLRICIDPRELNVALKRAEYPIPTIEEIIPNLQNAKIFTVVDTKDGFWNVKLSDESSNLTTFWNPFGIYKFLRMPFGLKTASEEYQRRLYEIFQGLEGIEIIADDILILGKGDSYEEALKDHDRNLENLFKTARQANLKFNINKVKLRLKEVKYLGHIITPHGLKPDPEKVKALKEMPHPESITELKSFLGFATYLCKFMPNISMISGPLRKLTMKNSTWSWRKNHQAAFEQIKDLASKAPILRYFDADKSIAIQCDASKHGLGATLLQESQPIIFASRSLSKTEQNYAQIEKECLAIVFACERFHQCILGKCQVIVQTDHKPLLKTMNIKKEATTQVGSFFVQHLPRNPSMFSGEGVKDPRSWLKGYERVAKHNQWDETLCLANTWTEFMSQLENVFGKNESSRLRAEKILKTRAQLKGESTEYYIQNVLRLCKEVDPKMNEEDKISHLMKGIAEELYQALLPRDVHNTEQFFTECRRIESLHYKRVTPTKYERLPNVASLSDHDDRADLSSMIRQIVREEVQRALGSTREEPKISTIEDMVKEEIGRTLAPISKPRRSSPQKERPREFYNNRYKEKLMRRYFGPYKVTRKISDVTYEFETFGNQQGRRKTKDLVHICRMKPYLNPEDQEDQLEEDPEDDSTNFQEEDIPTERTQQPQTREEISGPIIRSRALRLRI